MKKTIKTPHKSSFIRHRAGLIALAGVAVLAVFAAVWPSPVQAQPPSQQDEADGQEDEEAPARIPNLTVNFSLNSTLGPEETAHYARIVEQLLKDLPRKVELDDEGQDFVRRQPQYDKLKVVAYLPAEGEEDPNTPRDKDIRYFEVDFEVPKGLVEIKRRKELGKNAPPDAIVVQRGNVADFLGQKEPSSNEADGDTMAVGRVDKKVAVLDSQGGNVMTDGEMVNGTISMDLFAQELERIVDQNKVADADRPSGNKVANKAPEKRAAQTAQVEDSAVAQADRALNSGQTEPAKPRHQDHYTSKNYPNNFIYKGKQDPLQVRLNYFGDSEQLISSEAAKLTAFVDKLKAEKDVLRLRLVTQTNPGLAGMANTLWRTRLNRLQEAMSSAGIELARLPVSEIRLTANADQFVDVEVIRN